MKKDFTKKKLSIKQSSSLRWGWVLIAFIFLLVLPLLGYAIYKHKQNTLNTPVVSDYFSKIENWMGERKAHWQKKLVNDNSKKVKSFTTTKNQAVPQIHFEFYTALPNMQVIVTEPEITTVALLPRNVKQPMEAVKVSSTKTVPVIEKVRATSPPVSVASAAELEQAISDQIQQKAYIVQLGVFRNAMTADKFYKTLAEAGFKATVVKSLTTKKDIYRVQLGPFLNKAQAKVAQKQLQKKGIDGIVLPMDAG